ncbi:MCP four helix bundle domain-containing protein [Costertonia aggregata]|uniref:MCP four helix bundle domain-containing protein n=1 Tax=Costertonia aggregata TaxID=343403 RepID=A0A7H9ANC5_9FLAO|nr:MCP four helix bundle domain-containing protein [Costertonia aggregata]QLG44952.1 MCP four helix bundle domain-containing protein [Costertonia aggregata]
MPKKMTLKQRFHAGFILALAFFLVFASNRLNRRNFSTVEHTVDSVFEDRVVAQEYIYRLNNLFHKKEMLLALTPLEKNNVRVTAKIKKLFSDFEMTRLTSEENMQFANLKKNYTKLQDLEESFFKSQNTLDIKTKEAMIGVLRKISENLDKLSEVQLSEGRKLTQLSKKSLHMNQLLSKLEVAFLIIIGLLLLFIIFYREKSNVKFIEEDF